MKKVIISFICILTSSAFAMDTQKPRLTDYTEHVLNLIKNEDKQSSTSIYNISLRKHVEENYNFLLFFLENKNYFKKQYNQMLKNLKNSDTIYVALNHKKTKILLNLMKYLDFNMKSSFYNEDLAINYDDSIRKQIFAIIEAQGRYEDFEVQLFAVVEQLAKLLWRNVLPSIPNGTSQEPGSEKGEHCLIS